MDDIFEVQERVSREIVKALGVRLTSDEHRRLATRPIQDPRAFKLYLQARQEIRRYAVPRALPLLEEAIRIEGETPPLVAMRAWATLWMVRLGMAKDQSPLDEADRAARSLLAEHPDARTATRCSETSNTSAAVLARHSEFRASRRARAERQRLARDDGVHAGWGRAARGSASPWLRG